MSNTQSKNDPMGIQRGDYRNSLIPTIIFCLGRLVDIPIQLGIITRLPFSKMIPRSHPSSAGAPLFIYVSRYLTPFFHPFLPSSAMTKDSLVLTPYQAIITGMSVWLIVKHLIWITYLRRERLTYQFAFVGPFMDTVFEALQGLAFTFAAVNPFFSPRLLYLSVLLHVPAVALELVSEIHRKQFKDDPRNKGKVCMTGPWALARHINYGCNMIFGFAFGLACGGLPIALIFGGVYFMNFTYNAGPSIEEYCKVRYREKWDVYCKKVPAQFIPWLY